MFSQSKVKSYLCLLHTRCIEKIAFYTIISEHNEGRLSSPFYSNTRIGIYKQRRSERSKKALPTRKFRVEGSGDHLGETPDAESPFSRVVYRV